MEPDRNVKKTVGFGVRRLALLSILTALCYVGRMMFQFIPNVQPVTAVLIILTLTLGMTDGFIVAILSIVLTNFLLGMGPWTIAQIASFGVLIVVTGLVMKPFYKKVHKAYFVGFSFLGGILYGFIISLLTVKMMGINSFWAYYAAGIPFDLLHGLGNAGFYLILEPILEPLLVAQLKKR
ncbi:MAG: ECF transporter S component [Trichococcus sp.]|uniref:ECF transporter S component n=1 Tax=Trichococcus sp. TaxID=1985464 RepID=UPI003BECE573